MKLLIAEDQAALRRVIGAIVEGVSGEIRDCLSTAELEHMCGEWRPDFVVIDAEMQSLDTTALLRALQAKSAASKVIVVSGYDSADLRDAALRAGAVAYVVKDDLREIARLLEEHR
jgi:DNA-binding NarL/FixJ family response regulator